MIDITEMPGHNVIMAKVTGKLAKEDYDRFLPQMETFMEKHDKIRLLFEMERFQGWDMSALWEDTKFATKHFNDIERLALVGDKQWEKSMTVFCKPFTMAKVRYFDIADIAEARQWITENQD